MIRGITNAGRPDLIGHQCLDHLPRHPTSNPPLYHRHSSPGHHFAKLFVVRLMLSVPLLRSTGSSFAGYFQCLETGLNSLVKKGDILATSTHRDSIVHFLLPLSQSQGSRGP